MPSAVARAQEEAVRRARTGGLLCLWLALPVAGAIAVMPGIGSVQAAAELSVVVGGELVSIESQEAPLADVLQAIGEQAGFAVAVEGDADAAVRLSLAGLPVAEALRLLLRDAASAIIYERSAGRLVGIRVRLLNDGAGARSNVATPVEGTQPERRRDLPVTPHDWREDRVAFVRQAARAPREGALEELTTLLLDDDDATIRRLAAAALGRLRSEEVGEALASALADRDHGVRRAAARALGRFGGEQAIEALREVLMKERAPAVRQMAAYALSRMDDQSARDALVAARRDRTLRTIVRAALTRAGE
jgi:hypothetical protein